MRTIEIPDVVIYCDGFVHTKFGRNGGSVCVTYKQKTLSLKRFLLDECHDSIARAIKKAGPTSYKLECYAMYRALRVARHFKQPIIYSDCNPLIMAVNGYSEDKCYPKELNNIYHSLHDLLVNSGSHLLWVRRNMIVKILGH